jgi:hypothetical protein
MSESLTALWLAVAVLFGEVPAEAPQVAPGTQVQTPSGDANAVEVETQPVPESQAAVKPVEPAPEITTAPVACHVELEGNPRNRTIIALATAKVPHAGTFALELEKKGANTARTRQQGHFNLTVGETKRLATVRMGVGSGEVLNGRLLLKWEGSETICAIN